MEDTIYTKEFCIELLEKIDALRKDARENTIALTTENRPDDATTKILRAWLGFLDTLYRYGANAELKINNVELAHLFALDISVFRKLLNPQGNRTIDYYTSMDRQTFIGQVKQLPERLLLAHETEKMNKGRRFDVFNTPVQEYPTVETSGYNVGTPMHEYSHGYNTTHDNYMRGEAPDNT